MERVVGRADLKSEDSSPTTSPEPDAIERLRHLGELHYITEDATAVITTTGGDGIADNDELDFRMFATSNPAGNSDSLEKRHKIRLRSPPTDNTSPGFIQPQRNYGYYFTETPSPTKRQKFEAAAVTGQSVIAGSHSLRPGSVYLWKVLHLPPSSVQKSLRKQEESAFCNLIDDVQNPKRKRAGKSYRIKMRTKKAALQKQRHALKAAADTKESDEREKRTRRNREKKVKKKQRDKAKKLENAGEGTVATSGST